jgi:hypothetical protein
MIVGAVTLGSVPCSGAMQESITAGGVCAAQSAETVPPGAAAVPADARALYQALNGLRADGEHVYSVRGLTIRRDAVRFSFTEGKLAFLQPLGGRVTGAVFSGKGHVIATPHERGERRSLAEFLGVPILDQGFSDAYIRFTGDTEAEMEKQLQDSGAEVTSNPGFVEHWNELAAVLAPAHSLRVMADWLSAEPLPYFYTLLQTDSAGALEISVDQRRDEQVLIGQPKMSNGAPSYDVWASFRTEDSQPAHAEAFTPLDYAVDSRIGDDLSMEGKTTLHLKAARGGECLVTLELARDLTVTEIRGEDGQPLVYFQNGELNRRDVVRRANSFVVVVLPRASKEGEEFKLQAAYHGNVITDAGNGVEFVGDRETWYTHIGGQHFVPFDLTFHWPKRWTLVATGTEVESSEDGTMKSGRWRSGVPFSLAGFNLSEYKMASTPGKPSIQVYANKELEEAIVARLRQDTRQLPPLVYLGRESSKTIPSPSATVVPSPASALKQLGGEVLDSIHFFEKLNGDFPFDQLEVTQIPGSFGQGWPGLVYLSTLAFLPPEAQEQAGMNEWAKSQSRDLMPFHEVAHEWWGNVAGAASYRDVWIQEGMANYLALLYADSKKPGEHRLTNWLEHYREELSAKIVGSSQTIEEVGPLILGPRLATSKTPGAYEAVIYGKGTWVMHMLHESLRDPAAADPDARFRELLHAVLAEHHFRPLSTADFQAAVEKQMTPAMDLEGTHMDWFFDQWVRGTGMPHYKVKFEVRSRGPGYVITGRLEQTGVDDTFTGAVPLYAVRIGSKPERLGVVVTTGPETRFTFASRNRPVHLLIDPNLTLLYYKD